MIENLYAETGNGFQYHAHLCTFDGRTELEVFGRFDSASEWRFIYSNKYLDRRDAVYQMNLFAPNWSEQPL